MSRDEVAGVVFPASADGRRSTSAVGRAVVARRAARRSTRPGRWMRSTTPTGARAIWCTFAGSWKQGWHRRTRRYLLPAAGWNRCTGKCASCTRAARRPDSTACCRHLRSGSVATVTVPGTGEAESELSLPYRGERLRGGALLRRLDMWAEGGVIEPSCAEAVRTVAAHPQWLRLPGRTVVALGAGAEVGPVPVLLGWGARGDRH